MPGLIAGEGRKDVRENCRILRPYIIWKRRKEQLIEKTLICMIKQEEEKKKKEEEDKKRLEKEQRISRIQVFCRPRLSYLEHCRPEWV